MGAIIDDLTVGTSVHNIPQVINIVSQSLAEYGIVLALHKCLIYTSPQISQLIPSETPNNIPRSTDGFKLLGCPISQSRQDELTLIPIGNNSFQQNFFDTIMNNLILFLRKIAMVRHTQSAFQILLLSANNKIAHLLRTISAVDQQTPFYQFISRFDQQIINTFHQIMGTSLISENQIKQIRLPEWLSGLGLLSAIKMAAPAFIGSARQVLQEISERNLTTTTFTQLYNNNILNENLPFVNELQQNWNHFSLSLNQQLSSNNRTPFTTYMFLALSPSQLQHNLFNKLMDASKQNLISISDPMDKI